MPRLSSLNLEGLRSCIRPEYAGLPAEDLESVIESSVSGLPPDTAEDFLKALGSLGKAVGPTLQRAAPGVAQGAATGATVGGPWGAVIGAGAGLASSLLKTKEKPAQPAAPAPVVNAPPPATGTPEVPAAPALPTGQGAAATLLSLLQNPTVQQALLSQVLGPSGGQQVLTASGASLPRGAINSLLTQLLANASEALPESESISEQSYLQDASGEYLVDPASLEQQAALVLSHLRSVAPQADVDDLMEAVEWMEEDMPDTESAEWGHVDETAHFY